MTTATHIYRIDITSRRPSIGFTVRPYWTNVDRPEGVGYAVKDMRTAVRDLGVGEDNTGGHGVADPQRQDVRVGPLRHSRPHPERRPSQARLLTDPPCAARCSPGRPCGGPAGRLVAPATRQAPPADAKENTRCC